MLAEKEKEFFELVKSRKTNEIMNFMVEMSDEAEDFSRLCELGAIAAVTGGAGIGASRFFINLLDTKRSYHRGLNLLKVFIKCNSLKLVALLIEKGISPFEKTEEDKMVIQYVRNEEMLDNMTSLLKNISDDERKVIETTRISLSL